MLTLALLDQLLSPTGQAALVLAQTLDLRSDHRLRTIGLLRAEFPAELATVALETTVLRERARAKFSRGSEMYWTREALEQASGEVVARHRTGRFGTTTSVTDLCCSVGGDLLAFAEAGLDATGVDRDPVRLALAQANAIVLGVADRVRLVEADVATWDAEADAMLFFDPARRSNERRVWRPSDYSPPLQTVNRWLPQVRGLGVKVAPGIDYDALDAWTDEPCEVEVVSVGGDVKEATLWFGELRQGVRTATLLPLGATLQWEAVAPVAVQPPRRYLYEPDGAVIRAHLVEQLAHRIDATKIDDDIAFLTSETFVATPFARGWEVQEVLPFNLKQLRARLRELDIGRVVVKKRGSPIDPQVLEKQLRLVGDGELTVVLTQVQGRPSVILCRPVAS